MNGGKVYHILINKINNDIIKVIQQYNINKQYNRYLTDLNTIAYWTINDSNRYSVTNTRLKYLRKNVFTIYSYYKSGVVSNRTLIL